MVWSGRESSREEQEEWRDPVYVTISSTLSWVSDLRSGRHMYMWASIFQSRTSWHTKMMNGGHVHTADEFTSFQKGTSTLWICLLGHSIFKNDEWRTRTRASWSIQPVKSLHITSRLVPVVTFISCFYSLTCLYSFFSVQQPHDTHCYLRIATKSMG